MDDSFLPILDWGDATLEEYIRAPKDVGVPQVPADPSSSLPSPLREIADQPGLIAGVPGDEGTLAEGQGEFDSAAIEAMWEEDMELPPFPEARHRSGSSAEPAKSDLPDAELEVGMAAGPSADAVVRQESAHSSGGGWHPMGSPSPQHSHIITISPGDSPPAKKRRTSRR